MRYGHRQTSKCDTEHEHAELRAQHVVDSCNGSDGTWNKYSTERENREESYPNTDGRRDIKAWLSLSHSYIYSG